MTAEVNRKIIAYFINENSNLEIYFLKVRSAGSSVSKENIFSFILFEHLSREFSSFMLRGQKQ